MDSAMLETEKSLNPLLKYLAEKKLTFRNSVASLAAELRDVRNRLASKEMEFERETLIREAVEKKTESMEEEKGRLEKILEEKNGQLETSNSSEVQYHKELDNLRSQLCDTQATADLSAASAQAAQSLCLSLMRESEEKSNSSEEHNMQVDRLEEQLEFLQKGLQTREVGQNQLKDEVLRIEKEIKHSIAEAGNRKNYELRKSFEQTICESFDSINKHLNEKDKETARLNDEIQFLSAQWKQKSQELESQLERHQRADQELKKRVSEIEYCLEEARLQAQKLQSMEEKRDNEFKELAEQLSMEQHKISGYISQENFWESSGFKFAITVCMMVLAIISKR